MTMDDIKILGSIYI